MIPLAALPLDTGAALRRSLGGLDAITRSVIDTNRLAAVTLPPSVTTPALAGLNALQRAIGYRPATLALPTFPTFPTITIGDDEDDDG